MEFPFNIFVMASASDFKFGTQLGFAKAYHKKSHLEKSPALGSSPKVGVPFIISARAKSSDFKISLQVGFYKAHHKSHS